MARYLAFWALPTVALFLLGGSPSVAETGSRLLASLQSVPVHGAYTPAPQPHSILAQTCGLCTEHSDCGSGFRCCTGKCGGGQKACYQVDDCGKAR